MFMTYKEGQRLEPANYRGISIVNAISKVYDMVLNNRLMFWYTPSQEQSERKIVRGANIGRTTPD